MTWCSNERPMAAATCNTCRVGSSRRSTRLITTSSTVAGMTAACSRSLSRTSPFSYATAPSSMSERIDFLDEERIALGPAGDQLARGVWEVGCSEQVLDEGVALRRGQMAEAYLRVERCMLRTGRRQDAVRGMRRLGPRQRDEEQRVPCRQAHQRFEERDRRLVRPVQVLEHQHRRSRVRQTPQHLTHVLHDQLADELAAVAAQAVGSFVWPQAHHRGDEREHLIAFGLGHDAGQGGAKLRLGVRLVVVGEAGPAPQEIDEGVEPEPLADRQGAPLEHRHAPGGLEPQQFGEEPGLAEPGLSDDADDPPLSVGQATHPVREHRELRVAPDDRGSHRRRGAASAWGAMQALTRGAQGEGRLWIHFPLEAQGLEGLEGELAGRRSMRVGADPYLAFRCGVSQPRRQIDGVAHDRERARRAATDLAGDHQSRVDPDLERERTGQRSAELGVVLLQGVEASPEVDGGVQGLARRVLDGVGQTEQRHQAVAHVLVDDTAVAPHRGLELGEAAIEHRRGARRRQDPVERVETADAGEQHRPLAALARPVDRRVTSGRAGGCGSAGGTTTRDVSPASRRGAGTEEDATWLAHRLEPLGPVHGLAEDAGAAARPVAAAAEDDRTRCDADVQFEADRPAVDLRQLAHRRAHGARRRHAAMGVPEDGEDAVADVLRDHAVVRRHDVLERREAAVDEVRDHFGIERLGQRCEAGDVGDDHGRIVVRLRARGCLQIHPVAARMPDRTPVGTRRYSVTNPPFTFSRSVVAMPSVR